ncbi:MAG TPA: imidazole glycerol phosphate synthase subunit HisH [Dehalococcoidia bacterium]|nr:imidazole glycerol phosphate synthase subunit HisH [Dehalococcoidia bacterium]
MSVVIIDYGAGNLRSVQKAVERAGYTPMISDNPHVVGSAEAVILPGVGAAADTMSNLRNHRMEGPVREVIAAGTPFLGVCMGLQALLTTSEEDGEQRCLDIVRGSVRRLPGGLKVPHMGWNQVRQLRPHPIFRGIPDRSYFYFVHSYYAEPEDSDAVFGETEYGVAFASVVARGNLVATQFHPEKSGELGLKLYANFLGRALGAGAE